MGTSAMRRIFHGNSLSDLRDLLIRFFGNLLGLATINALLISSLQIVGYTEVVVLFVESTPCQ
jgi:hypothetical protein